MDDVILNSQQEEAKKLIYNWYIEKPKNKQIFTLAGYAGTGKTFLVNYIVHKVLELKETEVAFLAPTGKAASVLIQKGAYGATTIHKLIYTRIEKEYETIVNGKTIKTKKVEFIKKTKIPNFKLIIVDEVSMVSKEILEDLISFGIQILCCGDPRTASNDWWISFFTRASRL